MIEQFKCRASQLHNLMTNPTAAAIKKGETLSIGTKSYLKEWLKEKIYGREEKIYSKYLEKGIEMESEAIDLVGKVLNEPFLIKNNERKNDEFFSGEFDAETEDEVVDVKCPWDCFTFPLFEDEINKSYYAQGQVYMHLTDKKHYILAYCLMNTPERLIYDTENLDYYDYSCIPDKHRVKLYRFDYDAEFIEKAKERVIESRIYIKKLEDMIK